MAFLHNKARAYRPFIWSPCKLIDLFFANLHKQLYTLSWGLLWGIILSSLCCSPWAVILTKLRPSERYNSVYTLCCSAWAFVVPKLRPSERYSSVYTLCCWAWAVVVPKLRPSERYNSVYTLCCSSWAVVLSWGLLRGIILCVLLAAQHEQL